MGAVGIEAMNVYGGCAVVDVMELARYRGHDLARFQNLLMYQKSVAMPFEDPVSFAINAAKPIVDALSEQDRQSIELLITCSESGIDFGKSMSTYVHHYLGLGRNCRLFEIKQACYSGTAGFQMAVSFVLSAASPGAKALVIATDLSRLLVTGQDDALTMGWDFFEPSGGAGAVAMLVSDQPKIFTLDVGASGYYSYEVMDTCRPLPDSEAGNADLSLLSYLDCCDQTFVQYRERVPDADYRLSFDYLCFHTPFGGMVKGAHRNMMRKHASGVSRDTIEQDFERRVQPALEHCQRVGNIMGGTVLLSLASAIDHGDFRQARRVGLFSYGSGCSSEFYSGFADIESQQRLRKMGIGDALDARHRLSMSEYETVLAGGRSIAFGTRDAQMDRQIVPAVEQALKNRAQATGQPRAVLREIRGYHRRYDWVG